MSVVPSELTSEVWTRWQGHVINGVFPLGRFLGCSDHSGVFLTRSDALGPSEVAIKLLPTNQALAELQLPRWEEACSLAHPHLLGLLQWGECQLEGLPYLYVIMEYADQTLAQLLRHRALTDDEVREMLQPTLETLAFLHGHDLAQGQLKPTNILVVGDQLKLASDTMRRVGEGAMRLDAPTAYDSPEVRRGSDSTASDIWALGVTLLEAFSGRSRSDLAKLDEGVRVSADVPPTFREVVARCLRPAPRERPRATDLLAWVCGPSTMSLPSPPIELASVETTEPTRLEPAPPRTLIRPNPTAPEGAGPAPLTPQSSKPRALNMALLAAVMTLAAVWSGVRLFKSDSAPSPPQNGSLLQTTGGVPAAEQVAAPASAKLTTTQGSSDATTSSSALREVIPQVPHGADRTIRGHIKVWVRVVIDHNGSVIDATLDRSGSSRYFQRLAIEAAKKWTFPPADTQSRRSMQVRFEFSRDGTTAHAVKLD
jgi:TonB family protein